MYKILFSVIFVCVITLANAGQSRAAENNATAPIYGAEEGNAIPGRYIVVFRPGSAGHNVTAAAGAVGRLGGKIHYTYTDALQGFAASLPEAALRGLRHNPNIEFIEVDQTITLGIEPEQSVSTWNLDRIDQNYLPLDGSYIYIKNGTGVTAYIIDTGIRTSHSEFAGRASIGYDAIGGNGSDCNGHGTHVAGTVGGATYGVAKNVSLVAVRVLDCAGSGSTAGVIAGIDWVTKNKKAPAVANVSLGGALSTALDYAVKTSIASGVTYALAAGNSKRDACKTSPARVPTAITVGATTSTDTRASYSNYGACLDLFAPGSSVTSAWNSSDTASKTLSGTSMATPNVTGVAALYLQSHPTASPANVALELTGNATVGVVIKAGANSPNLLLHTSY